MSASSEVSSGPVGNILVNIMTPKKQNIPGEIRNSTERQIPHVYRNMPYHIIPIRLCNASKFNYTIYEST